MVEYFAQKHRHMLLANTHIYKAKKFKTTVWLCVLQMLANVGSVCECGRRHYDVESSH